jgi:hypothetical protein
MQPKKDIVDQLIDSIPIIDDDPHSQIMYQYGYLMGLLKYICREDFYAHRMVEQKIKQLTGKK